MNANDLLIFFCIGLGVLFFAALWSAVGWRGKARWYAEELAEAVELSGERHREIGRLMIENAELRDKLAAAEAPATKRIPKPKKSGPAKAVQRGGRATSA